MKLKYFLRGLGTGIIFTALVLTISYRVSDKNEMTDGQIIKKAKELGMVMETDELKESLENMQNPSPTPKRKEEAATSLTTGSSNTPAVTPESTEKPKDSNESKKTNESNKTEKNESEVKEYTKFTIQEGMSSAQVSRYLENIGLVDKAEKFDQYLCNNGYSDRISVGKFKVSSHPDYEEIARTITKSN